jgi:hypothetical protein
MGATSGRALGVATSEMTDFDKLGTNTSSTIGFYGVTPVSQRAAAIQAASVVSVSSNITIAASLTAWIVEVTNTLIGLGLWKGAA